jgi:D-sedoheptulose 7-phosphate isomerase
LVIGISGSGNSPNVLRAAEYAKKIGCTTIGVVGFGGGKLKSLVDHCFHVKVDDMQLVEDVHMILVHILMRILDTSGKGCC